MSIILFFIGVLMLLFAYLVGVKKMYNLISGVNTASARQKAKMNLPAMCKTLGIGLATIGFIFIISGGLGLVGINWAPIVSFAFLFLICWIMVIYIQRFDGNNYDEGGKPRKRYYITIFGVSALMVAILIFVSTLFLSTLSNPKITLTEDYIKIDGMYGTDIAKSDIIEVSLINQPVSFSAKTNGSAISGAYKGYFTSENYGPVLVFAKESSIPWICILRKDDKTVLLSLKDSDETIRFYNELLNWLDVN